MFSYQQVYNNFIIPEKSGKKIGYFRIVSAIFGGLLISYLGMIVIGFLIPRNVSETISVSLLFHTLVWACTALWISLSSSKLIALIRVIFPTLLFSLIIYIFIKD